MTTEMYQFIDFSYLDSLIDGDVETKQIILSTLLEEVPEELIKMENAMQQSNWEELHQLSHKLKSTLAYVGNEAIFNANQEIMMSSKGSPNAVQLNTLLNTVTTSWQQIEPELCAAMDSL
jgi:HPt (histidine-containing phosphotransfer) domain-containing protein